MDASQQLRKPRKSIRTLAGAGGASHLFRRLIPLKIKDGIFVCPRTSNLESLSARANGMCHRVIISQRCWLRANFVTRRANQGPSRHKVGAQPAALRNDYAMAHPIRACRQRFQIARPGADKNSIFDLQRDKASE